MSCQSYKLSRRRFVQAGGAGLATLLGLDVRTLVAAVNASSTARAKHVILLWMSGGMSQIDTFDPKPGRPTAGEFKPIATSASGIDISEILPNLAKQMHRAAIVRSIAATIGDHGQAQYKVLTGYEPTPQLIHPGMGSIVSHELAQQGDLPSYISIGNRAPSAGYLGNHCEAYYIGRAGEPDPYLRLPEHITAVRDRKRFDLLMKMNSQFASRHQDPQLTATRQTYQAARQFMQSKALDAFNLDNVSTAVREAYGDTDFGRGCLLAGRLVAQGVRFVQVNVGGFDTHDNNFERMRQLGAMIDPAIAALIGDLAANGLLDETLIVQLSEFGRTPRINSSAGRDHHPRVFSSLLAGGGITSGTVVGASDADGYVPADRPVSIGDIHATVCHQLGIDGEKTVNTPLGRPMRLVDHGKPVTELIA